MGTNYYVEAYKDVPCHECGLIGGRETLHIGKSSAGWKFVFNGHAGRFPTFKDWKEFINNNPLSLRDEYGRSISPEEFYKMVEEKQGGIDLHTMPDSMRGPWDHTPDESEYDDPEGYRFSRSTDFC